MGYNGAMREEQLVTKNPKKVFQFPFFLFLIDFLFVVSHLLFSQSADLVHLDREYNLPTVYQALKLVLIGLIILLVAKKNLSISKKGWLILPLGLMLIFLGIDEVLMFHENLEMQLRVHFPRVIIALDDFIINFNYRSVVWLLLYLPMIAIGMIYSSFLLKHYFGNLKKAQPFIFGLGFFLLAILLEYINSKEIQSFQVYNWLMTAEELSEMVGASFIGIFVWKLSLERK